MEATMSDDTITALEDALQTHINLVRPGFLVSGYSIITHLATLDDDSSHYFYIAPPRQPYHATLGLMQTAIHDFVSSWTDDE